ncbi:MAG: Stp1/IreP family PP2C-type Ser/Thr phosphatase [Deltaproteobacteria bacterium]|nr:Stp1/IreP family PP2C-type Ser/Thr phosphatase [Deltaproteobacteria bacterium]
MRVISYAKSDIGKRRKINQDAFYLDEELGYYVVADGMGGHAAGEVAARESVEATYDMILQGRETIEEFRNNPITEETSHGICRLMESAVQSATYLVYGMAEQSPNYQGMGTTYSALLLVGAYAVIAQVGDTRVYCLRGGETMQLTEDHTLINWQIREGIITPEEAKYSPHKNVITRAVGNKDYVEVDTQVVSVEVGDRFLICSDGLHGYLRKSEIPEILETGPEAACKTLIDLANDRGGKDNITVIVIEILE